MENLRSFVYLEHSIHLISQLLSLANLKTAAVPFLTRFTMLLSKHAPFSSTWSKSETFGICGQFEKTT